MGRVPGAGAVRRRGPGVRRRDDDRTRCGPRARPQGDRAEPRRGHGRGGPARERLMYALYTAVALIGLVTLWLPLALVRRLTRGVALNARARPGGDAPNPAGPPPGWGHAGSPGGAIPPAARVEGLRRLDPELPLGLTTGTR